MIKFAQDMGSVSRWATPQLSEAAAQAQAPVEDLDQLRQQGFDQGYNDGYKAGLDQAQDELRTQFNTMAALLDAMSRPLADLDEQVLAQLAQLAGRIARQLVRRELRTEPETILALVRDSVAILNSNSERIRIHLHPLDARVLQDLMPSATEKNRWEIVEDPLVAHGDCKVASLDSVVRGELQTRVNAIIWQCLGDDRA